MATENPLGHIVQHPIVQVPADLGFLTPDRKITILSDHIVMIIVAGILLTLFVPRLVRRRAGNDAVSRLVPTGWANAFEAICQYLRVEAVEPVLGDHTDRFIPYVWSAFFFILSVNLLGLLPLQPLAAFGGIHLGGTATGNIWVTGTLAALTLVLMVVNGLRFGRVHYIKHFSPGPLWLAPLLIPVEVIGLFARIFALAVRLFANMIAGHILIAVLIGLVLGAGTTAGVLAGLGVAVPVVLGAVAVSLLEVFVCVLHAFIFSLLTAVFIGMSVNVHHEHSAEGAEAHS
jgi:F-type H+-transporting ATPase subunit a